MSLKILVFLSSLLSFIFGDYWKNFAMSVNRMLSGAVEEPPAAQLSAGQIQLIRATWSEVENGSLQETGLVMFTRLFRIAPYLRDLFPFGHKPNSPELRTHALGVMKTVGMAVAELDDLKSLKPKLVGLGAAHKSFELTDKEFANVGAALIWTLELGLGDKFTNDVKKAWLEVFGFITSTMKEGLK